MTLLARCTTAILLVAALIDCGADSRPDPSEQPPNVAGWRTVWADEFDGSAIPDSTKWMYEVGGHGWGNNELQFYTESRRENARIEGGVLTIEARREEWQGRSYTSARLNSRQGWQYGRIEARARLPHGRGTWPAIWTLPVRGTYGNGGWPDNGEIDIMEHVGFDPNVVHASVHTRAYRSRSGHAAHGAHVSGGRSERLPRICRRVDRRRHPRVRRRSTVFLLPERATHQCAGGLASVAVRPRVPHSPERCGWRKLGRATGR